MLALPRDVPSTPGHRTTRRQRGLPLRSVAAPDHLAGLDSGRVQSKKIHTITLSGGLRKGNDGTLQNRVTASRDDAGRESDGSTLVGAVHVAYPASGAARADVDGHKAPALSLLFAKTFTLQFDYREGNASKAREIGLRWAAGAVLTNNSTLLRTVVRIRILCSADFEPTASARSQQFCLRFGSSRRDCAYVPSTSVGSSAARIRGSSAGGIPRLPLSI